MKKTNLIGLLFGVVIFVVLLSIPAPQGMDLKAWHMVAITALVAIWWIGDAIDHCITALLPIVLLPIFGITPASQVTLSYANEAIYLFMGGFMIALAMERSNLHRRFAIHTIKLIGSSPSKMILGFMVAVYILSMWVNNTATVLMMIPICTAIMSQIAAADNNTEKYAPFNKALLLAIAYSASIGGVATLIGTPPNIIFASIMSQTFNTEISFVGWMVYALPLTAVMLVIVWLLLTKVLYPVTHMKLPIGDAFIANEAKALGTMTVYEKRIMTVFGVVAALWIVKGVIDIPFFRKISDTTIAIAGSISLFLIPSGDKEKGTLLDWPTAARLPWSILILFGGGLAISRGFTDSGLSIYVTNIMESFKGVEPWIPVLTIVTIVVFLTEIMSNTATATLLIPVMISVAEALEIDPYMIVVPVTMAASFAFMLPVSTPPNAIVFSYGNLKVSEMARSGFLLNIVAIILLTAGALWFLPHIKLI